MISWRKDKKKTICSTWRNVYGLFNIYIFGIISDIVWLNNRAFNEKLYTEFNTLSASEGSKSERKNGWKMYRIGDHIALVNPLNRYSVLNFSALLAY